MKWQLDGGDRLEADAAAQPKNEFLQERLSQKPALDYPFHWFAFGELSTERPATGMGVVRIRISDIWTYAREWDMPAYEASDFVDVIKHLDAYWCDAVTKKQQASKKH